MRETGPLFASDDVDAMRELFDAYLEPGSVRLHVPPRPTGALQLSLLAGLPHPGARSGVQLYQMDIDREVEMRAVELSHAYTVLIRLSGHTDLALDGEPVRSHHLLSSPGTHLRIRFDRSKQWIVRIGQSTVEEAIRARLADTPSRPVRFDPVFRPDRRDFAAWLRLVQAFGDRSMSGLLAGSPLAAAHFEQMLVHGLLDIHPHTRTPAFEHDRGALTTPALRRALDFCERNIDQPITVADIAAAARTTVRTLQRAFRAEFGMSPLNYVRDLRLRRVRAELADIRAGHSSGTVTEVASRWGFTHLGRFSRSYRERYGESPSTTATGRVTP
ncbi:AraC family transcriptional regulator [Kibdelosporangium persicum]|uniref:AraC family transcriptional regulator n=1 Tax=Kibdelosporangium persicum TaxID=2698649 RepID=A0ABX2EWN7_9PSEU|nr:AraC family transcriptional regulator [Kibdelosporangium persicum]NRN63181.1 AraC family transcriptional regulator [Kibdelosporangium persicum]